MNQFKFLQLLTGIMLTAISAISMIHALITWDVNEFVLDVFGLVVGVILWKISIN